MSSAVRFFVRTPPEEIAALNAAAQDKLRAALQVGEAKEVTIWAPRMRTGRCHWHHLINAAILAGGIRPVKDSITGKLADEFRALRRIPGLLNKSGLALDEMARTLAGDFPEAGQYFEIDQWDGAYPEDLRVALEAALSERKPELEAGEEFPGEFPPEPEFPAPEQSNGRHVPEELNPDAILRAIQKRQEEIDALERALNIIHADAEEVAP